MTIKMQMFSPPVCTKNLISQISIPANPTHEKAVISWPNPFQVPTQRMHVPNPRPTLVCTLTTSAYVQGVSKVSGQLWSVVAFLVFVYVYAKNIYQKQINLAWLDSQVITLCCDGFSFSLLQKLRKPQCAKVDRKLSTHPVVLVQHSNRAAATQSTWSWVTSSSGEVVTS